MEKGNVQNTEPKTAPKKKTIPRDIQKQMLDFFMKTSIPRKKAKIENHLSGNKQTGDKN